jgi:hypothetical protein
VSFINKSTPIGGSIIFKKNKNMGGLIHEVKSTADFNSQLEKAGDKYVIVDYCKSILIPKVRRVRN